jgi:hypothetical protein
MKINLIKNQNIHSKSYRLIIFCKLMKLEALYENGYNKRKYRVYK